jgi:Beta-propeller repeat
MKKGFIGIVGSFILLLAACSQGPVPNEATLTPQIFATGGGDNALDVAANSTGVYVTGWTGGELEGPKVGGNDTFIRKYDNDVSKLWGKQFGVANGAADVEGYDVAVDSTGNSYIVGVTNMALVGNPKGGYDVFLRKYNSNGGQSWTRQVGTAFNDDAYDVTVDDLGNVYILSKENTNPSDTTNFRLVIRKYSSGGTLLLTINIRLSNYGDSAAAIDVDAFGNIYVLGSDNFDSRLYKFDSTGATIYKKRVAHTLNSNNSEYDLELDSLGNIYFTYATNISTTTGYLRKLDNNGARLWTRRLEPSSTSKGDPRAIAIDSGNNVYVVGDTDGAFPGFTNAGFRDIYVHKYDPSGTRLWTRQIGGNGYDFGFGIAVSDQVYITGNSSSDPNLIGNPYLLFYDNYFAQLNKTTGAVLGIDE